MVAIGTGSRTMVSKNRLRLQIVRVWCSTKDRKNRSSRSTWKCTSKIGTQPKKTWFWKELYVFQCSQSRIYKPTTLISEWLLITASHCSNRSTIKKHVYSLDGVSTTAFLLRRFVLKHLLLFRELRNRTRWIDKKNTWAFFKVTYPVSECYEDMFREKERERGARTRE